MLRETISVSEHFFMPPIQELIQLIFLSLYIKGDIFTWLPFSEYLLKSNRESLLLCVLFPEVCICYIKNTEQVMNYFLDMLHMFCPYFFPVTCLSAKTTISLIDFRKGKVLILKWDILKERLNCKKKKTNHQSKTKQKPKKNPKKNIPTARPRWLYLPWKMNFLAISAWPVLVRSQGVCKWAVRRFLMNKWWGQEGWGMTINNSFNVGFSRGLFCAA